MGHGEGLCSGTTERDYVAGPRRGTTYMGHGEGLCSGTTERDYVAGPRRETM